MEEFSVVSLLLFSSAILPTAEELLVAIFSIDVQTTRRAETLNRIAAQAVNP